MFPKPLPEPSKAKSADANAVAESDKSADARPGSKGKRKGGKARRQSLDAPFEITLVHSRNTHAGTALISLVLGVLLVWKLAIVGQVVGVVCLVVALVQGRSFLLTLLNPPGTIALGADDLALPAGLCRGKETRFGWSEVKHAFYLRRAVPWTRAGPVLVVEAGDLAFTYPRDWFASEAEQRRVLQGIQLRVTPETDDGGAA